MGLLLFLLLAQTPQPDCAGWRQCRDLALAAASRGDYEAFHDLAWRTVQKGPANDTDLMYILARAQVLSGRPHDALVMLRRIAALGGATDAATNEDFRRVRALPGWAEAAAALSGRPASSASPGGTMAAGSEGDALRFDVPAFEPAGLAYDAVSRRFVVGDREGRKLIVVDEVSRHVVNLVSAASAGFYDEITAFEIDPKRGDLWVISAQGEGASSTTVLHKLQLVSGRSLQQVSLTARAGAARFTDVAIASDGSVFVLDGLGSRIFRLRPRERALERVVALDASGCSTFAALNDRLIYVAHEKGILRVDVSTSSAVALRGPAGESLSGLEKLRPHQGTLVGVQRAADGARRIVRLELDATGRAVTRRDVLDSSAESAAATVSGDVLYYLTSGLNRERVVRHIRLP